MKTGRLARSTSGVGAAGAWGAGAPALGRSRWASRWALQAARGTASSAMGHQRWAPARKWAGSVARALEISKPPPTPRYIRPERPAMWWRDSHSSTRAGACTKTTPLLMPLMRRSTSSTVRWSVGFALAARTPLAAEADERAVELALRAIGDDGIGRCVDVAAASLATPGFVDRVARRLTDASQRAFRLWIDIAEATAQDHPDLVREACLRWRATGAMVALVHAGDALAR